MEWTPGERLCLYFCACGPAPLTASVGPLEHAVFTSSRNRKLAAAVITICLILLFYLLIMRPLLPHTVPGTVDLRVTDFTKASDGILRVSVIVKNNTPVNLNVLDDAEGRPAFILDDGGPDGMWLTHMVNQLKIHLAPGASLTNMVFVTNAPPRFRLKLPFRDLADEARGWPLPVGRLLPEPWRSDFVKRRLSRRQRWEATSGWILPGLPKDTQLAQPQ